MKRLPESSERRGGARPYMVAVVMGTALSALAPTGQATATAADSTSRAVHDLSRYCAACWKNARLHPDCWPDCTQEVLSRLMERVTPDAWDDLLQGEGEERREFLRAIDAVKKRTQRCRKFAPVHLENVADRRGPREHRLADDRAVVTEAAAELLSPRQQRILQLSFEGWSVHDLAASLNVPAERISDEKYKAIQKLRQRLAES